MTSSQQHIIRKVIVDVETKSESAAFRLKDTIDVFLKEEIFPSLERYFESLEEELQSQTIQISQLTLEVNSISDNDFKNLKEAIKKQVVQEFQKAIKKPNNENGNVVYLSSAQSKEQALIYFLEKGIPPWWNGSKSNDFLQEETILEISNSTNFRQLFREKLRFVQVQNRLINQFSDTQIQCVLYNAFKNEVVKTSILRNDIIEKFKEQTPRFRQLLWKKYFNYFLKNEASVFIAELMPSDLETEGQITPSESLLEILELISLQFDEMLPKGKGFDGIEEVIDLEKDKMNAKHLSNTISKKQQENINRENSDALEKTEKEDHKSEKGSDIKNSDSVIELKDSFVEEPEEESVFQSKNAMKIHEEIATKSIQDIDVTTDTVIGKSLPQKEDFQDQALTKSNKFLEKNETVQKDEVMFNTNLQTVKEQELNIEFTESTIIETPIISEEKGEYYIENAGLIILHPYLKDFFVNCDLLNDENKITDPELAIHLLHYIATKKEKQFESNMVFEKFLCGTPIHTSIRREIEISKELKQKSEAFLKAVISNWSALNNASPDLLRNEFLQRSGKINFKDVNPRVVVERKVQDILLDRIPWTLSICKLPWVNKLIFTDW